MHDGRRRVHEALCRSDDHYLETTERAFSASSPSSGGGRKRVGFQSTSASISPADSAPKRFKVPSAIRPPHTVTPSGAGAAASEKSVSKAGCVMIVKAAAAGIEMETPLPLPSSESHVRRGGSQSGGVAGPISYS